MSYPLAIVRYNDKPAMAGEAKYCFINIRPKYKDDVGLHVHEYGHVQQWFAWLVVFFVLGICTYFIMPDVPLAVSIAALGLVAHNAIYALVKPYAKWCEVSCYRKQIDCYPKGTNIEFAIRALMDKYKFKMTREEAESALRR